MSPSEAMRASRRVRAIEREVAEDRPEIGVGLSFAGLRRCPHSNSASNNPSRCSSCAIAHKTTKIKPRRVGIAAPVSDEDVVESIINRHAQAIRPRTDPNGELSRDQRVRAPRAAPVGSVSWASTRLGKIPDAAMDHELQPTRTTRGHRIYSEASIAAFIAARDADAAKPEGK